MAMFAPQQVAPVLVTREEAGQCRVIDRFVAVVGQQILLADIGDIARFGVLGEQMVEGLVLGRANLFGNRVIPFVAISEDGVDVEDHAANIEHAVPHDVTDREPGARDDGRFHIQARGEGRHVGKVHAH